MKKELLKQLQSYSALIAGLVAVDAANGQIVYTDVNPDENVLGDTTAVSWGSTSCGTYDIDLDDDGNTDYTLRIRSDQAHGAGFLDPAEDNYYINNPDENPFAAPLDSGDQIGGDESQEWKGLLVYPNGYNYLGTISTLGKTTSEGGGGWTGKNDKYLGLKFKIGSKYYYGWARMDARDDSRVYTLKDFAYESTAETPIVAGDKGTTVGIKDESAQDLQIFTAEKQLNIQLGDNEIKNASASVLDLSGKTILSAQLESKSTQLTVNAPAGIYFVRVNLEGSIYTQKVIIK